MATKPNQATVYRGVPRFLKELREKAGLTQRELAERIGQPQWWVHRCETGSRRVDVAEFVQICRSCGVDAAEVLTLLSQRL